MERPQEWNDDDSWWHQQDLEAQQQEEELKAAHSALMREIDKVIEMLHKGRH